MPSRYFLFITCTALAATVARAQITPPASPPVPYDKFHLDDVVVTANPLARAQDEIASPTKIGRAHV